VESESGGETVLTREELYNRIWKTPALRLAKEFGISDVGLAKVCKRHNIPRPPRGYWARLANGQRVKKPPLPQLGDQNLDTIRIAGQSAFEGASELGGVERSNLKIAIPDALVQPHPLIVSTRQALLKTKPGVDGLVPPEGPSNLRISVTRSSLGRAFLIYDSLIKYWESQGGKIAIDKMSHGEGFETNFELNGDKTSITLFEEVDRIPVDPKAHSSDRYGNCKYQPTGRLVLQINSGTWGSRSRWADGKIQKLESSLPSFVSAVFMTLARGREHRLDEECVDRQRALVIQVRGEAKRRKDLEDHRRTQLSQSIAAWKQADEIRAYLAAVKRGHETGQFAVKDEKSFREWMEWATWYAEFVDPLSPTPARPDFIPPPKNIPIAELDLTRNSRVVVEKLAVANTDELYTIDRAAVTELTSHWSSSEWNEICRVLEGLRYDVAGRYQDYGY
jgi:hypothetical protein